MSSSSVPVGLKRGSETTLRSVEGNDGATVAIDSFGERLRDVTRSVEVGDEDVPDDDSFSAVLGVSSEGILVFVDAEEDEAATRGAGG